ncbi:hypothetical protein [Streptomyces sp. NPDC050388]|uniref:hypothetical protein n=1 Tax=Streptomyces sp. NPDC050388 TaxID=3155781 RepID=UPI003420B29D
MTAEVRPEENVMTLVADFVPRRPQERGAKRVYGCPGEDVNGLPCHRDAPKGTGAARGGAPAFDRPVVPESEAGPERLDSAAEGVRQELTEYAGHLPGRH